jgi:hypothetical protein
VTAGTAEPVATAAPARLWTEWAGTRALTLLILVWEHKVFGDVRYYFGQVDGLFHGAGLGGTLREYPVPAVAFLALPRLVSGHWVLVYLGAFVALILAVDAAFSAALFRAAAGSRRAPGVTLWLWVLPLIGPMIVCRFDLLPAALAGGALLVVARRPVLAGALTGLGAAVKLWPAALLPSLWLRSLWLRSLWLRGGGRWRLLAGFGGVFGAALLLVAALAGGTRLVSPLTWQGERGLQLEAYAALPLLVTGVFDPGCWHVEYTRFYAFQVVGPGTEAAMAAATAASGLAVLLLAVLWLRAARLRGALPPAVAGLLGTLTVSLMAMTDKTLSPQYLIWVAALLAVVGVTHPDALPRGTVALLLATCALTQVIFPLNYDPLVAIRPYAVVLLLVRDAGLAAVAALVGRQVWLLTRGTRGVSA